MCHSLTEASGDTVQDDIDKVMVCHLDIDIESINILQKFLNRTYLPEISDFVKALFSV